MTVKKKITIHDDEHEENIMEEQAEGFNAAHESQKEGTVKNEMEEEDDDDETGHSSDEKYNELYNKYLRLNADFDNFRKRTNKEKLDIIQLSNKDLILAILPVIDDFERAMETAAKANAKEIPVDGINLIYNKFKNILQSVGLKEVDAKGKDFDGETQEAITKIPMPGLKGKVIDQVEKGYTLYDKIIRFAKVVVGE